MTPIRKGTAVRLGLRRKRAASGPVPKGTQFLDIANDACALVFKDGEVTRFMRGLTVADIDRFVRTSPTWARLRDSGITMGESGR